MLRHQHDYRILLVELRLEINTEKRQRDTYSQHHKKGTTKVIRLKPGGVEGLWATSGLEPFHSQEESRLPPHLVMPQGQSLGHLVKPEG